MASLRLTQQIRLDILTAIVAVWRAENPEPDMRDESFVLAKLARGTADPVFEEARDMLSTDIGKYMSVATHTSIVYGEGTYDYSNLGHDPLPSSGRARAYRVNPKAPEFLAYQAKKTLLEEHQQKLSTLRNQVRTLLSSVQTTKQLVELWPESKDYVAPYLRETKAQLPAVPVSRINEILGWDKA